MSNMRTANNISSNANVISNTPVGNSNSNHNINLNHNNSANMNSSHHQGTSSNQVGGGSHQHHHHQYHGQHHHHHHHGGNNMASNNNPGSGMLLSRGSVVSGAYPLRMLVHSVAVGAIIGRSGSTIKNITQQTKARIDVHREDSPEPQEKVITINGSQESCSDACFKILEVVQSEINAKRDTATVASNPLSALPSADTGTRGSSATNSNSALNANDPNSRDLTLKILAASNLIGRLIGRNGAIIKKLMEQTSTKINISLNSLTDTTGEHTIMIVGKFEQVRQAEKLISAKLRAAYSSDMNTSIQSMNPQQNSYLFNNVLLPYMPNGPYAHNSILASMVNPQTGHTGNPMSRTMSISSNNQGHRGHHHHNHQQAHNPLYTQSATGYLPFYPNPAVQPTGPGLLGFNPVAQGYETECETVYIYIPTIMVGAIIGKSGAAIKEMISTSGASIKVATMPPTSSGITDHKSQTRDNNNTNANDTNNVSDQTDSSHKEPLLSESADSPITTAAVPLMNQKVSRQYGNSATDFSQQISTRRVTIVGYSASQYSAQYMIYRKISIESGKGDISLMVEINVPTQFVGRIIGKGGLSVKQLQKQTRTTIRLPDDKSSQQSQVNGGADAEGSETCLQITGEFEGSQAAQRQIRNMVREGLISRQIRAQQQNRNNESNAAKNNAQMNNHQSSDSEFVSTNRSTDDKTTNEKSTADKLVHESPSMSCNNDRHEAKSQVNSSGKYDERTDTDNNNTITNNLNSSKQSLKDTKFNEQARDHRQADEISHDCLAENALAMVDQ